MRYRLAGRTRQEQVADVLLLCVSPCTAISPAFFVLRALACGRRSRYTTCVGGSDSDTKRKEYFVLLYTSLFFHQTSGRWQSSLRPAQGVSLILP
jgi:hypothetical protein